MAAISKLPLCIPRTIHNLPKPFRRKHNYCNFIQTFLNIKQQFRPFPYYTVHRCFSSKVNNNLSTKPIFLNAEEFLNNSALVDQEGTLSYADLLHHSMCLAVNIAEVHGANDIKLNGERIGLLTDNNAAYAVGLFATWMSNGVSVPLCISHPESEWEYFLRDSESSALLVSETYVDKISSLAKKLHIKLLVLSRSRYVNNYEKNRWFQSDYASNPKKVNRMYETRKRRWFDRADEFVLKKPALIVYTSGTTGRPKGVVLTHGNLSSMVLGMIKCWGWTSKDVILHVLPLHHLHGIANILLTPLACGAMCVMEPKFDASRIWHMLTTPRLEHTERHINLFMSVPTIYAKLIDYYENHLAKPGFSLNSQFIYTTLTNKIRLMVSGSSSLPQTISDQWEKITGHRLLERYGMTEIGMALSCPLKGAIIPGSVGTPMPNVEVRIVKPNVYSGNGYDVLVEGNSQHSFVYQGDKETLGDLQVRGPSVFLEYWKNPKITKDAFTKDGWFKTGDTVKYQNGVYHIVGRTSVDVIKSGGYKISALEIERHLLAHPDISDCAVVGLPDLTWGQKVAAVVVFKCGIETLDLNSLRQWASSYLPPYQLPSVMKSVEVIPRNTLGKVNKIELVNLVFPEYANRKW